MTKLRHVGIAVAVAVLFLGVAGGIAAPQQEGRIVARNLDNPCGIATQPETGHVFVSTNQRIWRFIPDKRGARSVQIDGFPTDIYGKGPMYNIGPLGLAFLDGDTLVVGDGGLKDGSELVRFFTVGKEPKPRGQATKFDDVKFSSGPIGPGDASKMGEGNFYALAIKGSTIFITCNGDDTKGWVSKIDMKDGKPGPLTPFIATKEVTSVDAPTAATISPNGKLVIGQLGEITVPGDSLLTFYDPDTGRMEENYKTGLNDLTGLAYSPTTGKLYGVDFSWIDTSKGGLFELKIQGDEVQTTKIASIDKPTAMTFLANGNLAITAIGTPEEGQDRPSGFVITFSGL